VSQLCIALLSADQHAVPPAALVQLAGCSCAVAGCGVSQRLTRLCAGAGFMRHSLWGRVGALHGCGDWMVRVPAAGGASDAFRFVRLVPVYF
jgi:hypothetical protein